VRRKQAGKAVVNPHSFVGHLEEFRRRLMSSAAALIVGVLLGWVLQGPITRLLMRPLDEKLYYSSPTGGLDFLMTLSICTGLMIALPVTVYHILKFIEPAGKMKVAHRGLRLVMISIVLALLGSSFAYFISLPSALTFLKSFDSLNITPLISAKEYLTFTMTYIVSFAIIFQLPLIISFIDRIRPMKPGKLFRKQRWVIAASFVIAAFATPTPDPINQAIMAAPLIVLFNISVLVVWLQQKTGPRKTQPAATIHIPATNHYADNLLKPIRVRVAAPKPMISVKTVDRKHFFETLPNFRHITDPSLLTVQDESSGRRRPIMRDIIVPMPHQQTT